VHGAASPRLLPLSSATIFARRHGHAILAVFAFRIAADQSAPPARRPLPIPTFDEFVLLHKAIMAAVSDDPAMLGALHGARRSFGWNMLGNLLDLGKIAFAPATPEVLRCISTGGPRSGSRVASV